MYGIKRSMIITESYQIVLVFLSALAILTVAGCILYLVWNCFKIKSIPRPHGPTGPTIYPFIVNDDRACGRGENSSKFDRYVTHMADTGSAVLIGFIITIAIIGIAGGVTLGIFICLKYRECIKRRPVMPTVVHSRQPTRRNRRIRVQNATGNNSRRNSEMVTMDLPPPYTETEADPPPPYSLGLFNQNQARLGSSRGNTRGSGGHVTPLARTRNSSFSVHINTGSTNTPMITPTGSMFASSVVNARGPSASVHGRQPNIEEGVT